MPEPIRIMIQVRSSPALAAAAFGPVAAAPVSALGAVSGIQLDSRFSPVPIPHKPQGAARTPAGFAAAFTANQQSTYVVRATVAPDALKDVVSRAKSDPQIVGIFADPKIQPISVCPRGPVGTDLDVERLLFVNQLRDRGLDGAGVRVVIVDTGFNLTHLRNHGKTPSFDSDLSWGPADGLPLGDMPVDHGTMCAYDVSIAAPKCTLVDHAVLASSRMGGSAMDGLLSDAVASYGMLLSWMTRAAASFAGDHLPRTLVVNNSWGMFHPSWDFPTSHPGNYSDNPNHPFNLIVASLEAAGADILFAAGNCGPECPDGRCEGATAEGIYGANSSAAVTCVAGVITSKQRIGYSTKGPGRLDKKKPDIASFTHFAGSGVYAADGGTSAATPVAAGVVAAIRRLYPASVLSPADLRKLLRESAEPQGEDVFDFDYGFGVINVERLLARLDEIPAAHDGEEQQPVTAAAGKRGRKPATNGNGKPRRSERAPKPVTNRR